MLDAFGDVIWVPNQQVFLVNLEIDGLITNATLAQLTRHLFRVRHRARPPLGECGPRGILPPA